MLGCFGCGSFTIYPGGSLSFFLKKLLEATAGSSPASGHEDLLDASPLEFLEPPLYVPFLKHGRVIFPFNRSLVLAPGEVRGIRFSCRFPPGSLLRLDECLPARGVFFRPKTDGCRIWGLLENCSRFPQHVTPRMDFLACRTSARSYRVPDHGVFPLLELRRTVPFMADMALGNIQVGDTPDNIRAALQRAHPHIFREGLGCCVSYMVQDIPFEHPLHSRVQHKGAISGPAEEAKLWDKAQSLVANGVLKEVDTEPNLIPTFAVPKKNGSIRMVHDFRKFNATVRQENFMAVNREFSLASVKPYVIGSALDIADAYYQVPLHPSLWKYFGICLMDRFFVYTRLPQGYHNAPHEFLRALRPVLVRVRKGISSQLKWYMDDLLLLSASWEEHERDLHTLLEELAADGWNLRPEKCTFFAEKFNYLGVTLTPSGLLPQDHTLQRFMDLQVPKTRQEWRRVKGWLNQLIRFIYRGQEVMEALHRAETTSSKADWDRFLHGIRDHTVRCGYDDHQSGNEDYIIGVDASLDGWGAYLGKSKIILRCAAGTWPKSYKGKLSNELEMEALCKALNTFRPWTFGARVVVYTDNEATRSLENPDNLSAFIRRRLAAILDFCPRIRFLPGKSNVLPDLLSRHSTWMCPPMATQITTLRTIPEAIWRQAHRGHFGVHKTWQNIQQLGFRCSVKAIRSALRKCRACQSFRPLRPCDLLGHLPDPITPGELVSFDFVGPLPRGKGNVLYMLVIVDNLTRWCHAIPYKASNTTNLIRGLERWISLRGCPKRLLCDHATYNLSHQFQKWCADHNMKVVVAAPNSHKSNGEAERTIQTLIGRLRRIMAERGNRDWQAALPEAIEAMRTTPHRVTGMTPNALWTAGPLIWQKVREHMATARAKANQRIMARLTPQTYAVGNKVWLWDYQRAKRLDDKFSPFWTGPWELVERVTQSLWKARSPSGHRVAMVHSDFLQPYV